MCGIAGAFSRRDLESVVRRMTERVAHRGPDASGIRALDDRTGSPAGTFGNRRLAVLDLSVAGRQPMESSDGRYVISYNGEIYNFRALREELSREGARFASETDTEVILQGVARHGPPFLARLRGMFAFALWDRDAQSALLARDVFGQKPLYLVQTGDALLFASEIRALLDSGSVSRTLSTEALRTYLALGSVSEPLTIVDGIRMLPAGTFVRVTFAGSVVHVSEPEVYAEPPMIPRNDMAFESAPAAATIRDALRDSVEQHLVSDVPVGLFLSGGIDSTTIVGVASEVSHTRLDSFTVGFAEREFSEIEVARVAARRFGTRHHEILLRGSDLLDLLPAGFAAMDQPSMDGLNTYALSRAVREAGLKVVLSGLGGDEFFAGYPSFRRAQRLSRLQGVPFMRLIGRVATGHMRGVRAAKIHSLLFERDAARAAYVASRTLFGRDQVAALSGATNAAALPAAPPHLSLLQRVTWYEATGYMLNTLLRDSDVFSMAHGLELRVPFVDCGIAGVAASLDDRLKLNGKGSKAMLVSAVRDLLPTEVWDRPKQGFTLPFEKWLRHELFGEVSRAFVREAFEQVGIDPFVGGATWRHFLDRTSGMSWSRPWALYTLIRWAQANNVTVGPDAYVPERRPRPRRVHVWAPGVFGFKGGIQVYQLDLLKALRRTLPDSEITVFAKNDRQVPPDQTGLDGVKFHFAGDTPLRARTARYIGQIMRAGLEERPDLTIAGHLNFGGLAYAMKRLTKTPYWLVTYGVEAWDVKEPIRRRALRAADLVMSISHHTRDRLLREHRIQPARVGLLPPTFDADAFWPAPKPEHLLARYSLERDQPVILTVGRLAGAERYKGYDGVIEAMATVRDAVPNAHYIIVGAGDDRPRIERRIAELGLGDVVTLAGFVPDAELRDYYNLCDVFAMPSKREGFGIVYLEAAACGKPVLGGNQDGAVDALRGGQFGALIDPDSVADIGNTLIEILQRRYPTPLMYDPTKLRQAVVDQFGLDRFEEKLARHFDQFVAERSP